MRRFWATLVPSYEIDRNEILYMDCPYCGRSLDVAKTKKEDLKWFCKSCQKLMTEMSAE